MRRTELLRRLAALEPFPVPDPALEQVATPPDAAVTLLEAALARRHLEGASVLDLGSGTGVLSIGAALLGAGTVRGVERDPSALDVARRNATAAGVEVEFVLGEVDGFRGEADLVVMNPPFGAQRRHADRPFWAAAFHAARGATYAFALAESRTFIARSSVERSVPILETRPVRWELPASFPHHRKPTRPLAVDLWVLGRSERPPP